MSHLLWFKDITKEHENLVGFKAVSLAMLYNNHFLVPQGFCLTTLAFEQFLVENTLKESFMTLLTQYYTSRDQEILEKITHLFLSLEFSHALKTVILQAYYNLNIDTEVFSGAGKQALELIKAGRESPSVAVRTSGLLVLEQVFPQGFLSIRGSNELLAFIKKAWSDYFLFCAKHLTLETFSYPTVIIQKMINSEVSGIVYMGQKLVVEALVGFELVDVLKDQYVLDK